MNKEYIEREAILAQIEDIKDTFSPTVRPMFDVFKHIITTQPAANVTLVVHGEWIIHGVDENSDLTILKCSNCGRKQFGCSNYCSGCGAEMDGGNKNA